MTSDISDELRAGIERYHAQIEQLGGYGARIRAVMPNGVTVEGTLGEAGSGSCQPIVTCDDGKRFRILDLETAEMGVQGR